MTMDEHHGAPRYADAREELIVELRQQVDDGIADSEDLPLSSSCCGSPAVQQIGHTEVRNL